MSKQGLFCQCGSLVLSDVGPDTIVDATNHEVTFKRKTDYVMCADCLSLYPVQRLREFATDHPGEPTMVIPPYIAA